VTRHHCICVVSAKGGSGKTVLSASIATLISAMNRRVTLVDCDAATNGLTLLYLPILNAAKKNDPHARRHGIFDEAPEDAKPSAISLSESLSLVPSSYTMRSTERASEERFNSSLTRLLERSDDESDLDFVILDAQAGTDAFAYAAVNFADEVIIVSEYDPVSAEGVERLKIEFGSRFPLGSTWTLYNKLLPEFATEVGRFLKVAGFLPPVPWDAEVVRSFNHRSLAIDLEKGNTFTLSVLAILEALLGEQLGGSISEWMAKQTSAVREPIRERIADLDKEIERIEHASVEAAYNIERITRLRRIIPTWQFVAAIGALGALGAGVGLFITSNGPAVYASIGAGVAALIGAVIPFAWRRPREDAIELEATKRSLERTIRMLMDERAKYVMLAESSIDQLLAQRARRV
jgi:cellulose biosynthesis protein BcsQ